MAEQMTVEAAEKRLAEYAERNHVHPSSHARALYDIAQTLSSELSRVRSQPHAAVASGLQDLLDKKNASLERLHAALDPAHLAGVLVDAAYPSSEFPEGPPGEGEYQTAREQADALVAWIRQAADSDDVELRRELEEARSGLRFVREVVDGYPADCGDPHSMVIAIRDQLAGVAIPGVEVARG